jgi:hypothetical protein
MIGGSLLGEFPATIASQKQIEKADRVTSRYKQIQEQIARADSEQIGSSR